MRCDRYPDQPVLDSDGPGWHDHPEAPDDWPVPGARFACDGRLRTTVEDRP